MNFINIYQTLIGSFLAIISSVALWYLQEWNKNRTHFKSNAKEIENIFLMAMRESELVLENMEYYVSATRKSLKNVKEIGISLPPRFNQIYINEERLFLLKDGLGSVMSQQVDIAISAAKVINGHSESFGHAPQALFDNSMRLIEAGITPKEKALEKYLTSLHSYLNTMDETLKGGFITAQRHLLRPVIACAYINNKDFLNSIPEESIDDTFDKQAGIILMEAKNDLRDRD